MSEATTGLLQVVQNLIDEADKEEGFRPDLLEMVDLDIEHSPVIAIRGEGLNQAVEAIKTLGGNYIVRHGMIQGTVSPDSLKRMRLRYLLALRKQQSRQMAPLAPFFEKIRMMGHNNVLNRSEKGGV